MPTPNFYASRSLSKYLLYDLPGTLNLHEIDPGTSVARNLEQKVIKFLKTQKDLHQSTFENPKYLHQISFKRQEYLHQSTKEWIQNWSKTGLKPVCLPNFQKKPKK